MFETILFPIDHSRESRDATSSVIELVKIFDSRLILLSVVETTPAGEIAPDDKMSSIYPLLSSVMWPMKLMPT